jgi:hypothetical protein
MMKKYTPLILLAVFFCFLAGCPRNPGNQRDSGNQGDSGNQKDSGNLKNPDNVLIGSWTTSSYISPAEAAKLSETPPPPGVSLELWMNGSATYHVGGKCDGEGEITFRIRGGDRGQSFKFYLRSACVWKIHGDILVETTEDYSMTPMDDVTRAFVEADPQFKAIMEPVKGESTSYKLKEVSDSKILLEDQELGFTTILRRKGAASGQPQKP